MCLPRSFGVLKCPVAFHSASMTDLHSGGWWASISFWRLSLKACLEFSGRLGVSEASLVLDFSALAGVSYSFSFSLVPPTFLTRRFSPTDFPTLLNALAKTSSSSGSFRVV